MVQQLSIINNMIKTIRNIIGTACLLGVVQVQAQQLPILNHYIYNPSIYNPARTGQNDYGTVNLHFKRQWANMPSAPFSGMLSVESPIKTPKLGNMGLGGMLYVDQMHIVTNIGGMATYAYHIPFQKNKDYKHGLSAGLSLGFIHQRFNYPDAVVDNPDDNQLLPSEGSGTSMDFSAGLDYQWRGLHVGVAMLQGLNTGLRLLDGREADVKYVNTRQWLVSASYKHMFGPVEKKHRVYLQPIFMGRIIENVPFQAEGHVIVGLDGMGWVGVGYRSSNQTTATAALEATLGVEIKRQFIFAYTIGFGVDENLNTNFGTQHEFTLAYRFGENKKIKKMQAEMDILEEENKTLKAQMEKNSERMETIEGDIQSNKEGIQKNADAIDNINKEVSKNSERLDKQAGAIDKNAKDIEELRKMLENQPLKYKKVGEVFFDNGSTKLSDGSKANLDAVKQAIDQAKATGDEIKIYVKGNASTNGDARKNMELSMRRATAVRQYLVGKGIDGSNITLIPMGEEDPTDGASASRGGDSKDRRVDIIFTQKKNR